MDATKVVWSVVEKALRKVAKKVEQKAVLLGWKKALSVVAKKVEQKAEY